MKNANLTAPESRKYASDSGKMIIEEGPINMESLPIAPGRSSGKDGIQLLAKNEFPYQAGPITEKAKGTNF